MRVTVCTFLSALCCASHYEFSLGQASSRCEVESGDNQIAKVVPEGGSVCLICGTLKSESGLKWKTNNKRETILYRDDIPRHSDGGLDLQVNDAKCHKMNYSLRILNASKASSEGLYTCWRVASVLNSFCVQVKGDDISTSGYSSQGNDKETEQHIKYPFLVEKLVDFLVVLAAFGICVGSVFFARRFCQSEIQATRSTLRRSYLRFSTSTLGRFRRTNYRPTETVSFGTSVNGNNLDITSYCVPRGNGVRLNNAELNRDKTLSTIDTYFEIC